MVTVFSYFLTFLSQMFSINSSQLLLSFAVVLHSPPSISRSLLTQSPHHILSLPRLLFPSTLWASDLCQFFTSHYFHLTGPFNLLLTNFFFGRYG